MSGTVRQAAVVDTPLSVDRLISAVSDPRVGGIALFIGVVREADDGQGVLSLDYTQHPSAQQTLAACAERAAATFDVISVAIEHRIGHLVVGDLAVVVAVGAIHRADALAACRQLIDDIKTDVPIWKEQEFVSGETAWVGLT